jgi:hypothetical protein
MDPYRLCRCSDTSRLTKRQLNASNRKAQSQSQPRMVRAGKISQSSLKGVIVDISLGKVANMRIEEKKTIPSLSSHIEIGQCQS